MNMRDVLPWFSISTAPRTGDLVQLRNRFGGVCLGRWQDHEEMKDGGAWFDDDNGGYISPYPIEWRPISGGIH